MDCCITMMDARIDTRVQLSPGHQSGQRSESQEGTTAAKNQEYLQRRLMCHYIAACSFVAMARTEDQVSRVQAYYSQVRSHTSNFGVLLAKVSPNPASGSNESKDRRNKGLDLDPLGNATVLSKYLNLLKFSVEACLMMGDWDELGPLFDTAFSLPSFPGANNVEGHPGSGAMAAGVDAPPPAVRHEWTEHWQTLGDLVLHVYRHIGNDSQKHHSDAAQLNRMKGLQRMVLKQLQRVMNKTRRFVPFDQDDSRFPEPGGGGGSLSDEQHIHLARWIRCIYQCACAIDDDTAVFCVEQAGSLFARPVAPSSSLPESNPVANWPASASTELEYITASAFNRAVDAFRVRDQARSRRWAEAALRMASCVGPAMVKAVQDRMAEMVWEEQR